MSADLHRPEPLPHRAARAVDRSNVEAAVRQLVEGKLLMVSDVYSTGVSILAKLRTQLQPPGDDASFEDRRAFRQRMDEASKRLLAPIDGHQLALAESPKIGFIKELYPRRDGAFVLPFRDVQALNSAWNWYKKGVHLAVLGHRVHPFFGTYVPARTQHLELFGTWLAAYKGSRGFAIDVGTGCGVLALMMAKAKFGRVLATDSNPNAIESVRREMDRLPKTPAIDLVCGDLLGDDPRLADLIVFNPPWMQGPVNSPLDAALYFEPGLFERFFEAAATRLKPGGRVVMVFSNVIELVQPDVPHPISAELERGRFRAVSKMRRKAKGRKRVSREQYEIWELALA